MKNTIKILQINKLYYPWIGGIETVVKNIAEGLQGKEYIEVIACESKGMGNINTINNIKVTKASSLGIFFSTPISISFPFLLRKKIQKFDILHFHLPFPLGVMSYLFFCLKIKNQKIIVTWHSDIVKQKFLLFFYNPFSILFLKRADKILVTSHNFLKNSPFLKKFQNKCSVISLGIDIKKFQKIQERKIKINNPENRKIILFVGRLSYYKGLEYLINAMKNINAILLIIGNGKLEQKLKKQTKKLKLNEKIIFLSHLQNQELKYCYKISNIFVLPSIEKTEAFGLVQLEAMLSELPVINTYLPTGAQFVSIHNKTGLTVQPKNSQAIANAINYLLQNPSLAKKMGQNGKKRVEKYFSLNKMLRETEKVYKKVLKI